jgi:hypothetical protein
MLFFLGFLLTRAVAWSHTANLQFLPWRMDVIEKSGIYFGGVHPDHVVHFLSYRTLCLASTGQEAEI